MDPRRDVDDYQRVRWSTSLAAGVGLTLLVLAAVLAIDALADGTTAAARWVPVAVLGTVASASLLGAAEMRGRLALLAEREKELRPRGRRPRLGANLSCTLAVVSGLGLGLAAAATGADHASAVAWGAATGLLVDAVVAAFLSFVVLRPRMPGTRERLRRRRTGGDSWDPRVLYPGQDHWEAPGSDEPDEPPSAVVLREISESAWLALARANLQRRYARTWQTAQFAIGLPAALFAGLAGASSLSDLHGQWRTVVGVLGLIGAGLTSLATALNAGKRAEESKLLATRLDAVGRAAHAYRETYPDGDDAAAARQFLSQLLARTDALMGAGTGTPTTAAAAVAQT